mgnify:CR=1 FL=1
MSEETRLAFAHPLARAEALAGDALRDRISLRDHVVEVEIGAFLSEEERIALFDDLSRHLKN